MIAEVKGFINRLHGYMGISAINVLFLM